jgi:hypothetical protein
MTTDMENPLLNHLKEDQRSFGEIASFWAASSGQCAKVLIGALVASFWKGELERDGASRVFSLVQPDSPYFERRPGNYACSSSGHIVKVGRDLRSFPTAERKNISHSRRGVAEGLGGTPELIPWEWDGEEEGLLGFSVIPFEHWPSLMQRRYADWRIRRDDFAEWHQTSAFHAIPRLEQFWPARVSTSGYGSNTVPPKRKPRPNYVKIKKAVDAVTASGTDLLGLRPCERNDELRKEMRRVGLTDRQIPSERIFREYFRHHR